MIDTPEIVWTEAQTTASWTVTWEDSVFAAGAAIPRTSITVTPSISGA